MTAHTDDSGGRPTARTLRRALRREVPSTVGLLADEQDFAAMCRYRSFPFDDHSAYRRQADALLRGLARESLHVGAALFDPEEYAWYCADAGLDPDSPAVRARYTAHIAATGGAVVPYTGAPFESLLHTLAETAVRKATHAYATAVLADLGSCADCGEDIGQAAFDQAHRLLWRLLEGAGPGTHQMVCSIPAAEEQLTAVLQAEQTDGPTVLDTVQSAEFVCVLATGIALGTRGGVVMRTTAHGAPDRLHGWHLAEGHLAPLTAAEVFNAYCTDAETGEPIGPEPDVDYRAGFDLGPEEPGLHH
ncbi:hypothetical protein [Streptomyces sp. NRRL F-5126]|uniref:hypothetical protein n=1 Tax=Streptomyces sp. NRRL F-5126 TaxID=1463857 RepID=UPI00056B8E45|nr:hypothetical protein [Streptomyces sp. NRRL F-5126]